MCAALCPCISSRGGGGGRGMGLGGGVSRGEAGKAGAERVLDMKRSVRRRVKYAFLGSCFSMFVFSTGGVRTCNMRKYRSRTSKYCDWFIFKRLLLQLCSFLRDFQTSTRSSESTAVMSGVATRWRRFRIHPTLLALFCTKLHQICNFAADTLLCPLLRPTFAHSCDFSPTRGYRKP